MTPRSALWLVIPLASFVLFTEGQIVFLRQFEHNQPTQDALPGNLQLSPTLKSILGITAPPKFEETVLKKRYTFKNREYLLKALLHESYKANLSKQLQSSYQPLDAIGSMVIEYMFTRHLLMNMISVNAHQLTTMKAALVNRDVLAFIALKNGFEPFMFVDSKLLKNERSNAFRDAVAKHEHYQDIIKEQPVVSNRPTPQNFIHRILKAVIGAVYVDSGYSIDTVDKVFAPMFKNEMDLVFNKVTLRNEKVL